MSRPDDQSNSNPSGSILEASSDVEYGNDIKVRAGLRIINSEVYAGGPILIEFSIENRGQTPYYLAFGGDRVKLRPTYFDFSASLEGADMKLVDPAAGTPELGGIGGTTEVKPGEPYYQTIILNQFLSLEEVRKVLKEGEAGVLQIRCKRALAIATTSMQALQMVTDIPVVEEVLRVKVSRNDAALNTLMTQLADELKNDWASTPTSPVNQERAITQLTALRIPVAVPYLQSLVEHPDPGIQMRVQRALAMITRQDD